MTTSSDPRALRLGDATWKDVAGYLARRRSLLVPVGTCEQHGFHLPLSCDALIAEAFADRIADATGVALAPTIPYGVNLPCDRFVPGTAGFTFDGLRSCLRSLLEDWTRQGFRAFFIITGHGCASGGFGFAHHEAIKEAARPLLEEERAEAFILFPYWTQIGDLLTSQDSVEHAGEVETSLALFLFPDRVRFGLASGGPGDEDEARYRAFPEGVAAGPPTEGWSGAEGDPRAATAEKGRAIFERALDQMLEVVKKHGR